MPELKQPQEAAEKTTEQPLTTKKKRAMLEYMAIMFAAAFLLVAISLLIKVIDMKGEMEAANTGARENIALLQKDLDAARAESAELQTQLAEANAASSEAADKLSEAETRLSEAEKARETLEKTLESAQKENDTISRRAQANELLVSAQAALEQGDYAALRSHLEALGAYADALKDDGAGLYEILRSYID
jgi:septal ring factor EnvC (AmiA/AmiB activator)